MKVITRLFVLLSALSIFAFSNVAAQDVTGLQAQSVIAVLGEDSYPFQYVDDDGHPSGLLVDLWREWGKVTGIDIVFVARHWQDSLAQLKQGRAQIHIGMARTTAREAFFDFANPISEVNTNLYLHKELVGKTNFASLIPYQIGVVSGSSHESELHQREPLLNFRQYPSREALFKAVVSGEILVFAGMEGYLRDQPQQQDIGALFPTNTRLLIKKTDLCPAVKKGDAALLAKINQGFAKLDPQFIHQIERRWLGYQRQQSGLTIAMQLGVEPYVDIGVDGQPHGLYVDMWRLWSEKTGIDIDFVPGDMNGSLEEVRRGVADVHIGYPESDDMKTGLNRAWLLYTVKSRLFVYGEPITDLRNLKGTRIGVVPTAPYIAQLKQQLPDVQLRFYDSIAAMVHGARQGDIKGFVASAAWTQHYLLLNKSWTDFHQFADLEFATNIYSLTRPQDSGLAKRIASGFSMISNQELAAIEQKWMLNPLDHVFTETERQVSLTQSQRAYLQSLGTLKVGYLKHWPPMEFIDDEGKFAGINSDVMQLLSNQLEVPITSVAFDDWHSLITALEKGEVDIAGSVANTAERHGRLLFSDAYWPSPWALVTSIDKPPMFTIDQLAGQRVAIVEGYHLVSTLMSRQNGLKLVLVADSEAGLAAVADGKADVFIEKVLTLASALQGGDYASLKLSMLTDLAEQKSHIGISLQHSALVPLVNLALTQLDRQAQHKIHQRWVNFSVSADPSRYQLWLKYTLIVASILSVLMLVMYASNRRLNQEIANRLKIEEQIKHLARHDTLTHLPNRALLDDRLQQAVLSHHRDQMRFAVMFIDLDGFKAVNDQYGHTVGDALLCALARRLEQAVRQSDTVARFGGDEFIVILNRIQDFDTVCQVAENMLKAMASPLDKSAFAATVSASIGIAIYPGDGDNAIELLKKADKLMYNAKQSGGNCYRAA